MSEEKTARAAGAQDGGMISRRALCVGGAGIVGMLALGTLKFTKAEALVRPPGAQDELGLFAACVRCQRCVEICPRGVIAPAHVEDGILGMRTPFLNFSDDYCDFCEAENDGVPLCEQACPTGAIRKVPAPASDTILGVAEITTDWCLAYRLIGCRECFDACPYEAMGIDDVGRPYVIEDKCTGCGACEAACLSLRNGSLREGETHRAIIVVPATNRKGA